jgi:FHS family L-fucose permease-like MFS transporter
MTGRFFGTWLMSFVRPPRLLAVFAVVSMALLLTGVLGSGLSAVTAVMFASFFMSIMFPTIFALGTKGLGTQMKTGSSLIIMAIAGGAVMPPILGSIADAGGGGYQTAFLVPALCFIVILQFAWYVNRMEGRNQAVTL